MINRKWLADFYFKVSSITVFSKADLASRQSEFGMTLSTRKEQHLTIEVESSFFFSVRRVKYKWQK